MKWITHDKGACTYVLWACEPEYINRMWQPVNNEPLHECQIDALTRQEVKAFGFKPFVGKREL